MEHAGRSLDIAVTALIPALAELALAYYRAPLRYGHLADLRRPLPRGFDDMLTELGTALTAARIDETARMLESDRAELEQATRFFVRHVLLAPGGDYYRYLGLTRRASPETVRRHYLMLIRMFHPDRVAESNEADLAYSSRINAAYHVLRDPKARRDYDAGLPKTVRQHGNGDPRVFFRPSGPLVSSYRIGLSERLASSLRRPPVIIAVVMAGLLIVAGLLLRQAVVKPTLRLLNGDPEIATTARPKYLSPSGEADVAEPGQARHSTATSNQAPSSPHSQGRKSLDTATSAPGARMDSTADAATDTERSAAAAEKASSPSKTDMSASLEEAKLLLERHRAIRPAPGNAPTQSSRRAANPAHRPIPDLKARQSAVATADRRGARSDMSGNTSDKAPSVASRSTGDREGFGTTAPSTEGDDRASRAGTREAAPVSRPLPTAAAQQVISRLEQAYARGDAGALAALFAADARTNEGSGRPLVRRVYSEFFGRAVGNRLSVSGLSWRAGPGGRLIGRGRVSVSNRYGGETAWRHASGRIELELAAGPGGYRITQLFYRLD